jgi:hypothetical protein
LLVAAPPLTAAAPHLLATASPLLATASPLLVAAPPLTAAAPPLLAGAPLIGAFARCPLVSEKPEANAIIDVDDTISSVDNASASTFFVIRSPRIPINPYYCLSMPIGVHLAINVNNLPRLQESKPFISQLRANRKTLK